MRFTSALFLAFSALTSIVSAQSTITSSGAAVSTGSAVGGNANPISSPLGGTLKAGSVTIITWNPTSGTSVNLVLREGKENNLNEVMTIASGIPNSGSFSWPIPKDLVAGGSYSIQIISGKDSNYSPLFTIDSTVTSSSTSSSSSSSSSTKSHTSSTASSTSTTASSTTTSSSTSSSSPSPTNLASTTPSTTVVSSGNSTTVHTSMKPTTSANASSTGPDAVASNINAGAHLASSLSLIFCIVAGIIYLN